MLLMFLRSLSGHSVVDRLAHCTHVLLHQGGGRGKCPAERNTCAGLGDDRTSNLHAHPHCIRLFIDIVSFLYHALDAVNSPGLGNSDYCSWSQLLAARDCEIKHFQSQQVMTHPPESVCLYLFLYNLPFFPPFRHAIHFSTPTSLS